MSFKYIEQAYGVRYKRGQRVLGLGQPGRVTRATHYLYVRLDGMRHSVPFHPTDVKPIKEEYQP